VFTRRRLSPDRRVSSMAHSKPPLGERREPDDPQEQILRVRCEGCNTEQVLRHFEGVPQGCCLACEGVSFTRVPLIDRTS
jgi:hypothetical protein